MFAALDGLSVWSESPGDAAWHLLVDFDVQEYARQRDRDKVYLARYARQSLLQWGDVDVEEIRRWVKLTSELVRAESATQAVNEQ